MIQVPCRNQPQQAITSSPTNTTACTTAAASTRFPRATVQHSSTQVAIAFLLLLLLILL
jgi:hypothetical protein